MKTYGHTFEDSCFRRNDKTLTVHEDSMGPNVGSTVTHAIAACALSIGAFCLIRDAVASESVPATPDDISMVAELLGQPATALDLARAKLALDKLIDPAVDVDAVVAELDRMAEVIRRMPGGRGSQRERLAAVRTFIYEAGYWNEGRPFRYDTGDPFGRDVSKKLLPFYLRTRMGNCVTMPVLFLLLAERAGVAANAATSPEHLFVRILDKESGRTFNVETTSGAHVARDEWYRRKMPITDEAIVNGVYLNTLSRHETVAVLASVVMEHRLSVRRPEAVIAVADRVLVAYPAMATAYVMKGSAYKMMIDEKFRNMYPTTADIPIERRSEYLDLMQKNIAAFSRAEKLGWRQPEELK